MRTVELALFGDDRARVRGLVDMMPAMVRKVEKLERDMHDLSETFKDGLAEVKQAIKELRSGRGFWLQILLAALTLLGVVITALVK